MVWAMMIRRSGTISRKTMSLAITMPAIGVPARKRYFARSAPPGRKSSS